MDTRKHLIFSIIKFFEREKAAGNLNEDQLETLEGTSIFLIYISQRFNYISMMHSDHTMY